MPREVRVGFVIGLLLIIAMVVKKVKGAIIIGIIGGQLDVTGKLVNPNRLGPERPEDPRAARGYF